MVYKQITEQEREEQWNKEMKTEKLAGVGRSQWFGCFLDHRFGSPFDTKWALTLHMAYPPFSARTYLVVFMPTVNGILPL